MVNDFSNYINSIVENLKSNYNPEKIILFGSYSDGTFSEDSDIDLLIVKKTKKHPIWRRVEARKASRTKIPMDILVYTPGEIKKLQKEKSFFLMDILENGKVLYEN